MLSAIDFTMNLKKACLSAVRSAVSYSQFISNWRSRPRDHFDRASSRATHRVVNLGHHVITAHERLLIVAGL